jgi:putative DNA primase/helicase
MLINKVIVKIEADTFIEQDDFFSRQNKYSNMIPVQNGVLNIDTRELTPHKPEYCFFNKLPISYDPASYCSNILKFLESVIPTNDDIMTLQEFYGSCLLKEYRYEKCLLVTGGGSNGKSKTLELLKYLLGMENIAEISPQAIEEDMFAKGELVNKMANISGDISSEALKNTGEFKDLTGRGLIMAPRKFKTRVQFTNYAKFIFSANEVPITYDLSDGFFRRWIIIDFPYRFLDPEDIDEIPIDERNNIKLKDPEIMNNLIDGVELSGFFNWCLDGYERLRQNKRFSNSQTIQIVKKMWIRKSSSIQAFLLDCIDESFDEFIYKVEFKQKYISYCKRHKLRVFSDKAIKTALSAQFAIQETRPWNNGDSRPEAWMGIKFKNIFGVDEDITKK